MASTAGARAAAAVAGSTTLLRKSATTATASSSSSATMISWAVGGWIFFIAENAILSENRTWLIERLGKEPYHACYGLCSTVATASIGYAYLYKLKNPAISTVAPQPVLRLPALALSWTCLSLGLILASQTLPKLQIPVALTKTGTGSTEKTVATAATTDGLTDSSSNNSTTPPPPAADASWKLQVRCPFDFTDHHHQNSNDVRGVDRISRHAGLWSLAFVGAANACLVVNSLPRRLWWMGPTAVAWLGGMHTDSRFRRGLGGTLDPVWDAQTSNVPLAAILTGRQGQHPGTILRQLAQEELKPLNALLAVSAATVFVASRGRRLVVVR